MDTRKLKYAGHTTVWNFEGQPERQAEIRDENDDTIALVLEQNTELELVRRFNSFPALVEALEDLVRRIERDNLHTTQGVRISAAREALNAAKAN